MCKQTRTKDHTICDIELGNNPDMIFQKNRVNHLGRIDLKKAGLAKIRVISLTPNISGELRWLLTPRILKSLAKGCSKSKSSAANKKKEKVSGTYKV